MNVLIVRLGALGDVVHAVPAAAALRAAFPDARIDWVVERRHRAIVDLVSVIDHVVAFDGRSLGDWRRTVAELRQRRYDIALDFQGLMKSAVLARVSGAPRVAGFSIWHLREKGARPFYSETGGAGDRSAASEHVIVKNLRLLETLGIRTSEVVFPLTVPPSSAADALAASLEGQPFAVLNPGAAWPNKRWPPERFGEVASFLRDACGLQPVVLWGPDERALAQTVVDASRHAARLAPPTSVPDLVAVSRGASLVVSGDTGPLHIAAAVGVPVVGVFGPTDPRRNGPWSPADIVVSRHAACSCHYRRTCRVRRWCLDDVTAGDVCRAAQERLTRAPGSRDA